MLGVPNYRGISQVVLKRLAPQKLSMHNLETMDIKNWESFEKIIDSREPQRIETDKKIWSKSLEDINLSDILIINNWISYAQITGDESYKNIYDKKINNNFVEDFLKDQLEFRQKSFKSI